MKFNHAAVALASLAGSAVSQTIVDLAVEDGRFTTLVQAVTDADLADALSGEGPLTVFAPVDDAFSAVPSKFLDPMYAAHLKNILLYHVIGDAKVMSTDLSEGLVATTLNGENVTVTSMNPVQINDVDVIIPDLEATNGVIHVVDEVLLPSAATKTIVDLAVATPELSTLVELVTSAGLVDVLSGDGPFTVFAPTNEAFAKLPAEVVKELMDPANVGQLTKILKFHGTFPCARRNHFKARIIFTLMYAAHTVSLLVFSHERHDRSQRRNFQRCRDADGEHRSVAHRRS